MKKIMKDRSQLNSGNNAIISGGPNLAEPAAQN